jgi:hypothetical protein
VPHRKHPSTSTHDPLCKEVKSSSHSKSILSMIRTKSHSDFYPRGPNEAVGGVEVALMSVWPEGELVLFAKVFIVWSIVSGIDLYLLPLVFNYMLYALTSKTTHNTIDMPESSRMHSRRRNTLHLHGQRHTHATFRCPQDIRGTSI